MTKNELLKFSAHAIFKKLRKEAPMVLKLSRNSNFSYFLGIRSEIYHSSKSCRRIPTYAKVHAKPLTRIFYVIIQEFKDEIVIIFHHILYSTYSYSLYTRIYRLHFVDFLSHFWRQIWWWSRKLDFFAPISPFSFSNRNILKSKKSRN